MASPKRKVLTLNDKIEAIKLLDAGKPAYKVAQDFGVGKTQIQNLRKRKLELINDFENNVPGESKRRRYLTGNEEINSLTYEWFKDASARRINISGPLLKTKALNFAEDLGKTDFKASQGWLQSFTKRFNIVFGSMSGERGDVNKQTVAEWTNKLSEICESYNPSDIFNMDETGLFFKDTTKKTFYTKGEDCAGGKRSKERITVALCASMTGEKIRPLVIGKSRKPRCFNKIKTESLPVDYYFNSKAWMTSAIFEDFLKKLNRKMKAQKRKILLFIDNAPSHPSIDLSNVEVKFLPPNTTSLTQPMDQGIIQATKLKFRKRQMVHMVKEVDKCSTICGSDILKKITILDAILWFSNSWNEVESQTIVKCFAKAGFKIRPSMESCENENIENHSDDDDDADDDVPLAAMKLSRELFDCEFRELVHIDNELCTCDTETTDWSKPASELLKDFSHDDHRSDTSDSESDIEEQGLCENASISLEDALSMVEKLKLFSANKGHAAMLLDLVKMEEFLTLETVTKCKQVKIDDYFGSVTRDQA
ncbi:tigger transposable element-derived protein 4-like [Argopecten irradians]|uniref:tigger transposable element-derived protein 4-like n=2 Tax=Argopecten irradians TaxID=31199 RepID=UPI00371EE4A8